MVPPSPSSPATPYFHAGRTLVDWPCVKAWAARNRWNSNGNCVLGLFALSSPQGLDIYGAHLHRFTLKPSARILDVPHDFIDATRCNQFYFGIKSLAEHMGFEALRVCHEGGESHLVVMNFDMFESWTPMDWPPDA